MRTRLSLGGLALLLMVVVGPVTAAHAAFPGQNGQIGFSAGPTPDLFAINSDATKLRSVITRPGADRAPVWSPDGEKVAWVNNASGKDQIFTADADGRNVRRFAQSSAFDASPSWSPDGRQIVFTSGRDGTGTTELYVADMPTGTNVRRITFRPLEDGRAAWSPDGTQLAWHSRETNTDKFHIYVMNPDGSNQHRVFPSRTKGDFSPQWSADGRRLLFQSYDNGGQIWVGNADGTGVQKIVQAPDGLVIYSPVFSPDSKFIAYTQQFAKDKNFEVWLARADGTGPASIIGIDKNVFGTSIDWQPFADHGAQPDSLLRDGGTEDGFGGYFTTVAYPVPQWETNGGMSVLRYGLPGFPNAPETLPVVVKQARAAALPTLRNGAGKRFFFGGTAGVSTAVQDVDLSSKATEIDTGRASVSLSGFLGGKGTETDEGTVVGTFLNGQGAPLGLVQIGPITPADRNNTTQMISRFQTATLPAGTRKVRVTLTATRRVGTTNDAYFDNIALAYTQPTQETPTTPPSPVQPQPTAAPGSNSAGAVAAGRVSSVRISPSKFAPGKGDTVTIAAKRKAKRGAKISFSLDRASLVTIKVNRQSTGRRDKNGQCVKLTKANRKRKRCTRFTTVATILRFGRSGRSSVAFTGRLRGKALAAGSYRLTASAANSASAKFRVVKR